MHPVRCLGTGMSVLSCPCAPCQHARELLQQIGLVERPVGPMEQAIRKQHGQACVCELCKAFELEHVLTCPKEECPAYKDLKPKPKVKSWWVRIDEAESRGRFTDDDVYEAINWVTCACGQQDARIPRLRIGRPVDEGLAGLGRSFYAWVNMGDFNRARHVLGQIENRAAELLNEMGHLSKVSDVLKRP